MRLFLEVALLFGPMFYAFAWMIYTTGKDWEEQQRRTPAKKSRA